MRAATGLAAARMAVLAAAMAGTGGIPAQAAGAWVQVWSDEFSVAGRSAASPGKETPALPVFGRD